jgi:hypothetical protein
MEISLFRKFALILTINNNHFFASDQGRLTWIMVQRAPAKQIMHRNNAKVISLTGFKEAKPTATGVIFLNHGELSLMKKLCYYKT